MKKLVTAALMLALAGLLSATTPLLAYGPADGDDEQEITIVMGKPGEFSFDPSELKLKAGETYKFKLINEGLIVHEFMVGRGGVKLDEAGKPHGYNENFFEELEVKLENMAVNHMGIKLEVDGLEIKTEALGEVELKNGRAIELEFTVPEGKKGEWEFACFQPGHYEAGQKGKLIVE